MTEHTGLPVAGYQPQSDDKVKTVNSNKELEERLLRRIDFLMDLRTTPEGGERWVDKRWLSIARTHFEQGFMAMNRAIFQPSRVTLPEDATMGLTQTGPE